VLKKLDVYGDEFPNVVDDLDTEDASNATHFFPDESQSPGDIIHGSGIEFGVVGEVLDFHD
jgi:hypothetical protein